MDQKAMFKITYGLYLATVKVGDKVNGCIINTVAQVANSPTRVAISISKSNYTNEMVLEAGKLIVTALSTKANFETFKHFGFQSGRDVNKFEGMELPTVDGIPYLNYNSCAYLVCDVISSTDLGSHTLFIAEVVDGEVLSDEEPITYGYYQEHVKPKPQKPVSKGYRCTVCNYVYEGETLPEDFICPLCKHGAQDFEKIV
ncbi:MAG: flavin reductase [Lachnospiraceae bacterium]